MAGTNDVGLGGDSAEAIAANLALLHQAAWDSGARTVALSIPASRAAASTSRVGKLREQVNAELARWCRSQPPERHLLAFIDSNELVPYVDGGAHWSRDGLHMSRDGYHTLGASLALKLGPLLQPWSYTDRHAATRISAGRGEQAAAAEAPASEPEALATDEAQTTSAAESRAVPASDGGGGATSGTTATTACVPCKQGGVGSMGREEGGRG